MVVEAHLEPGGVDMKYTVLIGRSDNGYAACVEGLSGVCVAAAETREETEVLIQEALNLHLEEERAGSLHEHATAYYREAPVSKPILRFVDMDVELLTP